MWKPVQWRIPAILALASSLTLLVACTALQSIGPTPVPPDQTYRSPEGLEVTVRSVEPNELAQILDLKRWRFDVKPPAGDLWLDYSLTLRRPDEEPETIASLVLKPTGEFDGSTLIALHPIDDSLLGARQVRYYLQSGGGSTSGVVDNPATAYRAIAPISPARLTEDGAFELMRFSSEGSIPTDENTVLVLTIEARERPER